MTENWKRRAFLVAGWLCVVLAAAGVVLPLLPTTPFVLLASSCFIRSSPRARKWLMNSRWFGPSLRDWNEHRAIRRSVKVLALVVCSTVIALTFFRNIHWGLRTAIIVIGAIGMIVVIRLPVIRSSKVSSRSASDAAVE